MRVSNLSATLMVGLLMACGSPPQPETSPSSPAFEEVRPQAEEPMDEQEEVEEESDVEDHVEPTLPPPDPPRPPCHTLDAARCPVTQGCMWYEKGGAGECRDE